MWQVDDIEANCRIPHEAAECRRHNELSAMPVTLSAFLAALDSFVFLLLPSGAASLSTLSDCILERWHANPFSSISVLLCNTDRQENGEQISQITVPSCSGHMIPCLSVVIEYLKKHVNL